MKLVIYGDFNCPYSCLASARADSLVARGLASIEWRAVEHESSIPAPSKVVDGEVADSLDGEVAEVRGLLRAGEVFPIARPPILPNTATAIAAFAAASSEAADELRRGLFAALWFDGRDIGDPVVVESLGGEIVSSAVPTATAWQEAWLGLDRRLVPMLVLPDGYVSRGLGALARLADMGEAG